MFFNNLVNYTFFNDKTSQPDHEWLHDLHESTSKQSNSNNLNNV